MDTEQLRALATKADVRTAISEFEGRLYRSMWKTALVFYVCTNIVLWMSAVAILD